MGLPQLETCCFFFDLKTGNIILGCLNAVLSFNFVVVMIIVAATLGSAEMNIPDYEDIEFVEAKAALTGNYVMCIILTLMFLVKFLFDIFFVYGVVTGRRGVIKAYFIMWVVFFLLSMSVFFLNVTNFTAGITCFELFYFGFNIYAILLCNSYYTVLNTREEV